jgi:hypothetical protein
VKYNNELYVGGNFNGGIGMQDIAKFDGTNWVSVGGGLSGANTVVDDMIVFNNELYISGHFLTMYGDPGNLIARWDGASWSSLGTGLDGGNCIEMHIFKNKLYVGGSLITAGGMFVNNSAIWTGTGWTGFGAGFNNTVTTFASENDNLYIGGGFLTVNGDSTYYITRYNLPTGIFEDYPGINSNLIYPNPTTGLFNLEIPSELKHHNLDITISDITGQIVYTEQFLNNQEVSTIPLYTDDLATGIYTVTIEGNERLFKTKMVKL